MAKRKHLHERRGITFQELGALLGTRELLSYVMPHSPDLDFKPGVHAFNMRVHCDHHDCGSVSCIGGTMALIMGVNPKTYVGHNPDDINAMRSPALKELFFPPHQGHWDKIDGSTAIVAINNWLARGKPGWNKLMGFAR